MDSNHKKVFCFGEVIDAIQGEIIDMNDNKDSSKIKAHVPLAQSKKKRWKRKTAFLGIAFLFILAGISTFLHYLTSHQKF